MNIENELPISDDNFLVVNEEVVVTTPEIATSSDNSSTDRKPVKTIRFFEPDDYENGALYEQSNYCWSQTRTEVEVHIRLPDGLKSSKQINVLITPSKIKITPKLNDSHEVIVDGEVDEKFKYNEAMWTISANGKLTMSLDKKVEIWWKRLFQHEPAIDVTKIDCSQPIDELTEETRRDIERIQWDEEQKLSGKPTSSQLKQHELLKKAWDVDGSPFKGMPFDPSLVQFENS